MAARVFASAFAALLLSSAATAAPVSGYVVADASAPHGVIFQAGAKVAGALAWGDYDAAALLTTGWAVLNLHTDAAQVRSVTLFLQSALSSRLPCTHTRLLRSHGCSDSDTCMRSYNDG